MMRLRFDELGIDELGNVRTCRSMDGTGMPPVKKMFECIMRYVRSTKPLLLLV